MWNGGKQTWKRVRGRGRQQEYLSPSLPNPAPSPFFLAHFSLRFPNYLRACYRLTTSFVSKFLWFFSTSASSTFDALLLISTNGFGSTNFSAAFRRCIFQTYFSLLSSVSLTLPPTLYFRQEGTTICFASAHSLDYSVFLAYAKIRAVLWSERLFTD